MIIILFNQATAVRTKRCRTAFPRISGQTPCWRVSALETQQFDYQTQRPRPLGRSGCSRLTRTNEAPFQNTDRPWTNYLECFLNVENSNNDPTYRRRIAAEHSTLFGLLLGGSLL